LKADAEVRYIALSRCEESVPDELPKDILVKECYRCTKQLGIESDMVEIGDFKVRHFPQHRQEILEKFVAINREFQPDLVMLPASTDMHQDHSTVSIEGFRAFKHSSILGYELPQNMISFNNAAFIRLSEEELDLKVKALKSYQSQNFRNSSRESFIRNLAGVRGVQSNTEFAEAFETIRLICP